MAKIAVVGAGYVGLVTGACLAQLGHSVVCIETNAKRLRILEKGDLPIYEPGLGELVASHRRAGRLTFTSSYADGVAESEFAFITVNTPALPDGHADISNVYDALHSILRYVLSDLVIVIKSTVPVGTGDSIAQYIRNEGVYGVEVVSNPEFIRQGSAIGDFLKPDRIVIGTSSPIAGKAVANLTAGINAPVFMCSRATAELSKYAANALLSTRISFVNQLSALCESVQADIEEVTQILGEDRRIGRGYLQAGLGWGGSCFPKDVRALMALAADHGHSSSLLQAAFAANYEQREKAFQSLFNATGSIEGATVGVLGLAFKPNTDDIRESPALDIIQRLLKSGIQVRAHDPAAMANSFEAFPTVQYCRDGYQVAEGSDALLLATEWPNYLTLDWHMIRSLMRGDVILDGRNVLNGRLLTALGFRYLSFGKAKAAEGIAGQLIETALGPSPFHIV